MGTGYSRLFKLGEKIAQFTLSVVTAPVIVPLGLVLTDTQLAGVKYVLKGPSSSMLTFSAPEEQ
jgi:hypothetical protein